MKLHYLGTAAAEGFPGMFCNCETCERARTAGGRNIRTRSQALLDDRLLIDFPADTNWHLCQHGISFSGVHHCLITHAHSDHFYPADLEMRGFGMAPVAKGCLTFYAGPAAAEQARQIILRYDLHRQERVQVQILSPYRSVQIDRYTVIPLPANHDPYATPYVYLISDNKTTLFYAHDTGLLYDETWDFLSHWGKHIDFLSLDCTGMRLSGWRDGHLSLDTCADFVQRLKETGTADKTTRICLNHFSHNGKAIHDELVPLAARAGFDVAYDGKVVEIKAL